MARPRLVAHLVVVADAANHQASATNLLGVDYPRSFSADTEFPTRINQFDVFVRFFTWGCCPETLAVEIWRVDSDGHDAERVHLYVREVPFRTTEFVQDHIFRLVNVAIPAVGVYAVRVCRLTRSRSRGVYWKRLRDDFFRVVRRP